MTPEQKVEELKQQGGIDITKAGMGALILVETTMAVYEITVLYPSIALVEIEGTDQIFHASKGPHRAELLCSNYDEAGTISIPRWIGKGLRMGFKTQAGIVIVTSAVKSARITSPDKRWEYEL